MAERDSKNISFDCGDTRFEYRVAAVILIEDRVLLQTTDRLEFWIFPGGRVELQETAKQSLLREIREELQIEAQSERLLWSIENFFSLNGRRYHEMGFTYSASPVDEHKLLSRGETFSGMELNGIRLQFQGFRIDKLPSLRSYQSTHRTAIDDLPDEVEHVIQNDFAPED